MTATPDPVCRGLFVSHRDHLEGAPGGAQVCTREFVDVLGAAGVALQLHAVGLDARLETRIARKLRPSPYFRPTRPGAAEAIAAQAREFDFVFLNQMELATLGARLRALLPPSCRIVALSHGLDSTDLVHLMRLKSQLPLSGGRNADPGTLGRAIAVEQGFHAHLDLVCALSPSDVVLHQWLGAARVDWLPRVIRRAPLAWAPAGARFGYYGTLNHAPNLEGLTQVLDALAPRAAPSLRVRVVGAPSRLGAWLVGRYPCVDYLGPLDDAALTAEAASWNAALHPIFCHPRGCSTKLASAIGWEIPIVTTEPGRRGYEWADGALIVATSAQDFADECLRLLDPAAAEAARRDVRRLAAASPTVDAVAGRMRRLLEAARAGA